MGNGIASVPAAYDKLLLHHLPHKGKPQRYLFPQRAGQSQFIKYISIHNDLVCLSRHMSLFQCNEQIRQYAFIRCKPDLRLTFYDIVRYTERNRITAFFHQRIGSCLFILLGCRRLYSRMKPTADLPHGIFLYDLHGAACQRKDRRKQNAGQRDGKNRKYIAHPVVFQTPAGQFADGCTVIVSHMRTSLSARPVLSFLT